MTRFDLTSFFATISFFVCVTLFLKESLSFFDFLQFLLLLEGIIFLIGAITIDNDNRQPDLENRKTTIGGHLFEKMTSSPARINQMRYFFGLFFLFSGILIDKLVLA